MIVAWALLPLPPLGLAPDEVVDGAAAFFFPNQFILFLFYVLFAFMSAECFPLEVRWMFFHDFLAFIHSHVKRLILLNFLIPTDFRS